MHLPRIKELLAIRGHLQDELLRIHDMIVEVDSDLSVSLIIVTARNMNRMIFALTNGRHIYSELLFSFVGMDVLGGHSGVVHPGKINNLIRAETHSSEVYRITFMCTLFYIMDIYTVHGHFHLRDVNSGYNSD